jgi:hypothetical protein
MLNTSTITEFFGPLRCYSCGNYIKEVALSKSGDEEHIYCRHCWAVMEKEAKHRRECEKIKAKCLKTLNAEVKAECVKALKRLRCASEYYKGCEEAKAK